MTGADRQYIRDNEKRQMTKYLIAAASNAYKPTRQVRRADARAAEKRFAMMRREF